MFNLQLVTYFVSMVAFSAASLSSGTVVVGPSGVVTDKGAIGPHGSELGYGKKKRKMQNNMISVCLCKTLHKIFFAGWGVGAGLGLGLGGGLGLGYGAGLGLGHGLGHGAVVVAPTYQAASVLAAPISYATPVVAHQNINVVPVKVAALTPGGGSIGVSAHGAAIHGPPTAPVVVAGPSGKIAADGLWGPTANVGHTYGHGW